MMKITDILALLTILLLATLVILVALSGVPGFEPLPWDMSHHYLGAQGMKEALRSDSMGPLFDQFVAPDYYPPGHSLALGAWLLIWGESVVAWKMFFGLSLWAAVGALWWCSYDGGDPVGRRLFFVAASILLLVTVRVVPLAATFMIDVPATTMVLFTVAALAGITPRFRTERNLLAWLFFSAALLTKYNVALPLAPAAGVFAGLRLIQGRRREAVTIIAVIAGALSVWALYLTCQTRGWEWFLAFAENRANSMDWAWWQRLDWYLQNYVRHSYAGWPVAAVVGGFVLVGLGRWRSSVVMLAAFYVLFTMAALARHPYLLTRNLVPVAALLTIPFAAGVQWSWSLLVHRSRPVRRLAVTSAVLAVAVVVVATLPSMRQRTADNYSDAARFAVVSEFVDGHFASLETCRVVGTFNEFSAGWVRILWQRSKELRGG